MTLEERLNAAAADLDTTGARWALIGGWALSAYVPPRFTEDADFAVAITSDTEADTIVFSLRQAGYGPPHLHQHDTDRVSMVQLEHPVKEVLMDLMFNHSGIETEIVDQADEVDLFRTGLLLPVARLPHLIAMKALADREKDLKDLDLLIPEATPGELGEARHAARLIQNRGLHPDKDVPALLEAATRRAGR